MSGRAISQQGLATTCEDPLTKASTVGGGRDLVWRRSVPDVAMSVLGRELGLRLREGVGPRLPGLLGPL